jgi:hypothetical protein
VGFDESSTSTMREKNFLYFEKKCKSIKTIEKRTNKRIVRVAHWKKPVIY